MKALAGKVALVTGGSRGIGAAIAQRFAHEGANVAVHGRDRGALAAVCDTITKAGGRALDVVAELTKFDDIERMRARIEAELGPLDIVVANAGGSHGRPGLPLEETTEQEWHIAMNDNLIATFLTLKSLLPAMKARRSGAIVTISSTAARQPHPMAPLPYGVAKAGIQMLTQILATQAGPYGIRVNCLAPETILTERNRALIPDRQRSELVEAHPLRRLGLPEDVASAALFLASEQSPWITGVILDVAGGAVML
jgi:3-oxoacyl-[acyl-carrier protein] reductase